MSPGRILLGLGAALLLAGCGGRSDRDVAAGAWCPTPLTLQDAQRLVRFRGASVDPREVVFEAAMSPASSSCEISRNQLEVELKLRITAIAGPALAEPVTAVPFFVRLLDGSGRVVQGQDFTAEYKLSAANPRGSSQEEIALKLPFSQPQDLAGYWVVVGLRPTPQELQYNRRAAANR